MVTGETRYGTEMLAVPAMHQDGSRMSTEFSIVMLKDDDGKPLGVAAIMRDITERRQQEKELRDRLVEFESGDES